MEKEKEKDLKGKEQFREEAAEVVKVLKAEEKLDNDADVNNSPDSTKQQRTFETPKTNATVISPCKQ